MVDYWIFGFGLVVTVIVGFGLATMIIANNRAIERESMMAGQPDALPLEVTSSPSKVD